MPKPDDYKVIRAWGRMLIGFAILAALVTPCFAGDKTIDDSGFQYINQCRAAASLTSTEFARLPESQALDAMG
jgi:hypothetical protein